MLWRTKKVKGYYIRLTKFSNGEALNEAFERKKNTELNFVSLAVSPQKGR